MGLLFISTTVGYPSCFPCYHNDILPGASFKGGLMMKTYIRVKSALEICSCSLLSLCILHMYLQMLFMCNCHTLLFFREESRG